MTTPDKIAKELRERNRQQKERGGDYMTLGPDDELLLLAAQKIEEQAEEIEKLRNEIKERDRQANEGYQLSEDSQRMHRFMNSLDIDDLDERAEALMKSQFDGVMVGENNRATIKSTISQHFHAIHEEAIEKCAKIADNTIDPEWPGDDLSRQAEGISRDIRSLKSKD